MSEPPSPEPEAKVSLYRWRRCAPTFTKQSHFPLPSLSSPLNYHHGQGSGSSSSAALFRSCAGPCRGLAWVRSSASTQRQAWPEADIYQRQVEGGL